MEENSFKNIATFQYSSEAIILKGKLESEGIEVFMRDNNIIDANPFYSNAVGGVKLFVRSNDLALSKEILAEIYHQESNSTLEIVKNYKKTDLSEETTFKSIIHIIRSFLSL